VAGIAETRQNFGMEFFFVKGVVGGRRKIW
jgi:hypothetical protein